VRVRPRKSITAFSLYLDFGGYKWFDIFFIFRSVVDCVGHSFNWCLSSLVDPLSLVTENFGLGRLYVFRE